MQGRLTASENFQADAGLANVVRHPAFSALQGLSLALLAVDTEDSCRIVYWSAGCETLLGFAADRLVDNPEAWCLLFPDMVVRESHLVSLLDTPSTGRLDAVLTTAQGGRGSPLIS